MHGNSLHGMQEVPVFVHREIARWTARKTRKGTAVRYETGKSDSFIVPENHMNKAATALREHNGEGLSRTSAVPEPTSKAVAECEEEGNWPRGIR